MIFGQLEHSARYGRRAQGDEFEPGKHLAQREQTDEPIGELGEVTRQVLGAEVVIRAMQGALDVSQDRIDLGERRMLGACRSTSGHERLVKAPCVLHGTEAGQGVGQPDGAGVAVAPGQATISSLRNAPIRHRRILTGRPSRLSSTAATNGVLPSAPRPRLPPWRSPTQYASASCTHPKCACRRAPSSPASVWA